MRGQTRISWADWAGRLEAVGLAISSSRWSHLEQMGASVGDDIAVSVVFDDIDDTDSDVADVDGTDVADVADDDHCTRLKQIGLCEVADIEEYSAAVAVVAHG